jgi:hypothetical protein
VAAKASHDSCSVQDDPAISIDNEMRPPGIQEFHELNSLGSSFLPFANPEAGFDYFATQAHYRSLASRILTALGGFNVVVVTGDRLSGGPMFGSALGEAAAGRYTVIGSQDAMRFHTALPASSPRGSATHRDSDVPALLVFYDTDRYSDKQIEKILTLIHQHVRIADHRITAAVFLARTEFLTRLDHPVLRVWLAKHLFVARLRFHELGADEIASFIHHQLAPSEAEKIFTHEAMTAIANVSGGDPVMVNRFSRRMLECAAVSTGNTLEKANLGSATLISPDLPPRERGVTTFADRLQRNYTAPEPDPHLSTRIWPDRSVRLKLGAAITFCFACVAAVVAVAFIHPVAEDIAASSTAPATYIPAKLPEHGSLTGWAPPNPNVASTAEEPTAVPGKVAITAMTAPAAPTPEDALAIKTPALPPSVAALRPTAEPATPEEAAETVVNQAVPPAAPIEVAATATADSPTETQAPRSTPPTPDPLTAQLRLPATEIAALLARGDALFARGDISSARLFYERAADAGEGRAALRLGHTYDPVFLDFAHLGVRSDPTMAESWYRRARGLGETEAEILLTPAHRHRQNELTTAQHKIAPGRSEHLPNPSGMTRVQPYQ